MILVRQLCFSCLFLLSLLPYVSSQAAQTVNIAIISDIENDENRERNVGELLTLVGAEFDLKFTEIVIDWNQGDINTQVDKLYANPHIDMVLAVGVAANQLIVRRKIFSKPTFLPYIVERDLVQAPYDNGTSGKKNLSYLTYSTQFLESIDMLREVVPFSNMALLGDETLLGALPEVVLDLAETREGLTIQLVPHNGVDHNLIERIPEGVDAVMFGHLPRFPPAEIGRLIETLTEQKIATFSYLEEGLVEKGLLATPINETLYQYAARRNALNMQAVMLGEPASAQPVVVESKSKLTINQATANKLGVAIDFQVLVDAEVVGFGHGSLGQKLSLLEIAEMAIERNLKLKNERYSVDIQGSEVELAKGRLRPQLAATASYLKRKGDSSAVQSGFASENSTDVVLSLNQTLFSDSEWTNYKIQSLLLQASNQQYRQTQLDIIREASLAMANVLQAQAEASIQQENISFSDKNLELARDRVAIGVSSSADQYRWETQAANGKSALFGAFSRVLIAKQNLNSVLNLPITEPLELKPLDMDRLMVFSTSEAFNLMDNTASFEKAYEFALEQAYDNAPELHRLSVLIQSKEKEIALTSRRAWMPELSLSGQLSENIDRAGVQVNQGGNRDWQVMLNARVPFYRGGQSKAERKKAKLELVQLQNQLVLLKQQLAQTLRSSMNNLLTSLFTLRFSKSAAEAANKSLSLVTDSYNKGAVAIVDLLDAQNSSVSSNLSQVQASINFFRSNIEMQRIVGTYEFFMSEAQREDIRSRIKTAITTD